MSKVRIAFVQRNWDDNLGILWISSLLKKYDFVSRIFIEQVGTYRELLEYSPNILCYSCITGEQSWVLSSIKKALRVGLNPYIVVGGPHATFFPSIIENPLIDAICLGEGEYAMLELAKAIRAGKEPYNIRNFYFNIHGEIIKTKLRPLISDLDAIPFPDRSYYDRYNFLASNPYKIFITGRGCPFQCTFCFNHVLHELYGKPSRYIRRRSPENVIEELHEVKERWGIDEIRFSDDHFAIDTRWLRKLTPLYKREIGRPYTINARVDALDEEKIGLLKESGCRLVCFGIETGREDYRNKILNKKITDEQIYETASIFKKYKMKFLSSNIIGLPNETPEDAWKTIEINQNIGTDLPWYSMMQYYPGTKIYKEAKMSGLIDEDFDVNCIGSYFRNRYIKNENIAELENIHSFSILASKFKFILPIARYLTKRIKPNIVFKLIFEISYVFLSIKRANFHLIQIIRASRYYYARLSR